MARYYTKSEWEKVERRSRTPLSRQEPKRTPIEKRHLTLQPFSLVRNDLPYRNVPGIIIKGLWLEDAGFNINDQVTVTVHEKELVIRLTNR